MTTHRCVGIDQGYSQMGIAILEPGGALLASERLREPHTDGHDRAVALSRLHVLLARLKPFRDAPVRLAGYCYADSGVAQAFEEAGWTVVGTSALNDVVGVYGLSDMRGHAVVAGCGTYAQVVYVDARQAVRWPGEDVAPELPPWLLSGEAYARFVAEQGRAPDGADVAASPWRWAALGPALTGMLDAPDARRFVARAAEAVVRTRDVFWRHSGRSRPPDVLMGGGAVAAPGLWAAVEKQARARGVALRRVEGPPAVGLARFAMTHPDADAWAVIGETPPAWLR